MRDPEAVVQAWFKGVAQVCLTSMPSITIMSSIIIQAFLYFARSPAVSEAFTAFISPPTLRNMESTIAAAKQGLSDDLISNFCKGTNEFWKSLVIKPVQKYVEVQPAGSIVTETSKALTKLMTPPEQPGIPRPVWLTNLGSIPTVLVWYGYYKFLVEEELFQYEMEETGKVSGAGGFGTIFLFVYGILIGFPMTLLHIPGGKLLIEAAGAWILVSFRSLRSYSKITSLTCGNLTSLLSWGRSIFINESMNYV
jgi:hypothetical protein